MEKTTKGFLCSQCGEQINTKIIEIQDNEKPDQTVFIIDHQDE